MRYSQLFGKTVRSVPSELKAESHKLLYKGGFIRQISTGRYAFLPLGFRVAQKIINIIEEEMQAIGSQRVETPTLHPIDFWKRTNRDKAFGEEMLVVTDHQGASFAIGATAEGLMTELVKMFAPSYKDLPIAIHQFSQKFRDEKRPRGGLLRVREFMMKDAYSFHASEQDLLRWYEIFYNAYLRIAKRLDLRVVPVLAESGAIGGEYNHEFMVASEVGEDLFLMCSRGDYAANIEKAISEFKTYKQDKKFKERKDVKGVGIVGVEALAKFLKIPVEKTTKTLIYQAEEKKVVAAMIRGDYEINEVKLKKLIGVEKLELANEETVETLTGAKLGYAGPINLPERVLLIADLTTKARINFEVGANKTNYHCLNVNFERDFPMPKFADIRKVKDGDNCAKCRKGKLKLKRAIEWGHVFHQGQFYTKPHGAMFTDKDGKLKSLWSGAYGIGIGRSLATIVETHHDKDGIIWPPAVTPYDLHLLSLDPADKKVTKIAKELYEVMEKSGLEVLYDDRDESAGVKLKDGDLIGIPVRIIVSKRSIALSGVEVSRRGGEKSEIVGVDKLAEKIREVYSDN